MSGRLAAEGEAGRPMWTCPRCEHRFVTANLRHSCTRHTLDDAFARSTPEARAAFERYAELAARCGPIEVIAQKTRIVIMGRVRFAGATVLPDVDAIAELPDLVCEGYRDLGMQGLPRRTASSPVTG